MAPLILASASPRRADLLRTLGVAFTVHPADVDESVRPGEAPAHYVERLAEEKARAVATLERDALVVAADTAVVLDGDILGKPVDAADARQMLRRLAGRAHEVLTGVAVVGPGPAVVVVAVVTTIVRFRPLDDAAIDWYVATGEPLDKAGAYGIQGIGGLFVDRIDGNYHNVVGLPLAVLDSLLIAVGHRLVPIPGEGTAPAGAG